MLIKKPSDIPSSEITPRSSYLDRRKFMAGMGVAGAVLLAGPRLLEFVSPESALAGTKLPGLKTTIKTDEKQTPYKDLTTYNNFYEYGVNKDDPAREAYRLKPQPWKVLVEGFVKKPLEYDIDQLMKMATLEERIYRHRCVEGWSMVIPWVGYSLSNFIKQVEPASKAKYIEFVTLADPAQMPGVRQAVLDWPYVEGLRMDEAMHPLALLCFGLYGETLPNQNGAPVRVVLPWKYGFKSCKSIVKIRFVDHEPKTAWNKAAPNEYGFYSNVNPNVDHPRWSQKTERRIDGSGFFASIKKRETQMFNGYSEVAGLYSGMDLKKYY
ncbi:MAG: protein-methionine-sulfoxide reductase catalytic subunit MsrP [Acidobacteriia bacterium]|nr:protein-methionine-sulfoxide reductase catalytic subunit MsrP [Terriglobia bacterium]